MLDTMNWYGVDADYVYPGQPFGAQKQAARKALLAKPVHNNTDREQIVIMTARALVHGNPGITAAEVVQRLERLYA